MTHFKIFGTILVTALCLTALPTTDTPVAHAAAWHQGTPKAIQGKWRLGPVTPTLVHLKITKDRFYFYSIGPLYYLKNVRYRQVKVHTYQIRGYEYSHQKTTDTIRIRHQKANSFQFKGIYPNDSWLTFNRR